MIRTQKKIKIIPLGQNCMPRTILTRWKVKPSKFFGEPSYPFDLAVFGMPEITKSLRTDFNEFFNDLEYNGDFWIKAPNCIYFSHDKKFKENDKYQIIQQYSKRIENFKKAIQDNSPILFIQILGDSEDVFEQYKELKRIRNFKPFKFLVIDTQGVFKEELVYEDLTVKKIPYPTDNYKDNWWKKEFYNSPDGKTFEKQIVDFCVDSINSLR